jgi:hypothetical protein
MNHSHHRTILFALAGCVARAQADDYLTPGNVVVPPPNAAQEAQDLSASQSSLRVIGLDVYPHAAVTTLYDDNLLISHTHEISGNESTLSPGLTLVAGDVSTYLPGSLTLGLIRGLLNYSPVEDTDKPQRFLGVDYTPSLNAYPGHSRLDNVDQTAGLTAGYVFSRLTLGLDQDYSRMAVKDNDVGNLVTEETDTTKLRSRYDLTDRSFLEVNGQYYRLEYPGSDYEGYQEIRNEDWFNRLVEARLTAGVGAAFGYVDPDRSDSQTYEQLLARAIYHLTGKLDIRTSAGVEWREYASGVADTIDPVFSLAAIYHPRDTTTLTLEGHRREQPDFTGYYNYQVLGFSAGVRQELLGRLYAGLEVGYDQYDYSLVGPGTSNNRTDSYVYIETSLECELSAHWMTKLFYKYRQDDSTVDAYSYGDNIVGLQVSWQFQARQVR